MKNLRTFTLTLVALVFGTSTASATVITFDDLHASGQIPNGYAGFDWSNGFETENTAGTPNYQWGVVSPFVVAENGPDNGVFGALNVWFSSNTAFTFNSAYLTGGWNNGLHVEVKGFIGGIGGTLLDDKTVIVNSLAPTLEEFNYSGVNTVEFISSGGTNAGHGGSGAEFVMDNVTINASSTPEPASLTLLCVGVGIFLAAGWFRKKRKSVITTAV